MLQWDLQGYRTVRLSATEGHSIETQVSGPCAISVPHRGWHTVSVYPEGATDVCIEAADYAGEARLAAGECQILPGALDHRLVWSGSVVAVHVHLPPETFGGRRPRFVHRIRDPLLGAIGERLYDISSRRGDDQEDEIDALAAMLRGHLRRVYLADTPASLDTQIGDAAFAEVHRRMRGPAAAQVEISELAALAGLSERQFRHVFGALYGTSPKRFILRHRVEHAKVLIHRAALPMTEVALEAGFYDQAHFGRTFSAWVGQAPSEYARWVEHV